MFWNKPERDKALDAVEDTILSEMQMYGPEAAEFEPLLSNLERIHALRAERRKRTVSPDAMLGAVTTLGAILIVVAYEQKHVWTTKALMFLPKPK